MCKGSEIKYFAYIKQLAYTTVNYVAYKLAIKTLILHFKKSA